MLANIFWGCPAPSKIFMPCPVAIRPVLPVARYRHINQLWVDLAHILKTRTQRRELAGAKAFDDDIGGFRKGAKLCQPLGGFQIKRHAALATVQRPKQRRELPGRIADARAFNHDIAFRFCRQVIFRLYHYFLPRFLTSVRLMTENLPVNEIHSLSRKSAPKRTLSSPKVAARPAEPAGERNSGAMGKGRAGTS